MGYITDLVRSGWPGRQPAVKREVVPLEGTNMSLWNSIIPDWWSSNISGTAWYGTADLADRV